MSSSKIHILMIDDDPMMLRLFGGQFAKKGVEMIYAHDGQEGREVARRLQPDLILLDYRMPVWDGMQTAKQLKSEKETAQIPIIFLTNEDVSQEGQKYWQEVGAEGYIHKGSPFKDIFAQVKQVLKSHGKEMMEGEQPKPSGSYPGSQ